MLLLVKSRLDDDGLKKTAEDLDGYIKVVIDIEEEILAAGGKRHFEGEEMLLREGSIQRNLWGGGLDLETGEIDFDSMINIRPNDDNSSREVLSLATRKKMEEIIRRLLR